MANKYSRLAGVRVSVTTEVDFYTVPSSKITVGELYITNTTGTSSTYQVAVVTSATVGVLANGDFPIYNKAIAANDTQSITIHMSAAQNLRVRSTGAVDTVGFIFMANEQDT